MTRLTKSAMSCSIAWLVLTSCVRTSPTADPRERRAPRVLLTEPTSGDESVPATLTEIRVTFDQDMKTDRFSWIGGGPNFPQPAGQPTWKSGRVAALPVKLAPCHEYAVGINGEAHRNFQSVLGEPVSPQVLQFSTACGEASPPMADANRAALADLRRAIEEHYSYRELRHLDWDKIFGADEVLDAAIAWLSSAASPQDAGGR